MATGHCIKEARKKAGMTQKELAKKLGIAYQTLAQWENNLRNPKMETLYRIAAALGVDWTELVPEDKQGAAVVEYVTEKAGLTVKDKDGNIIRQGDGRKWSKMTDAEQYRAGVLQFRCEEERIAYFYNKLTDEGRIAAGGCFFQHLDKGTLSEVADYIMNLSENQLYQRTPSPQSTPFSPGDTDTTPLPAPPKDE